jgi:hypothetical protein
MFNEFSVKLIAEVRKREILYNTKYDKRPKAEKERGWEDIGEVLNCEKNNFCYYCYKLINFCGFSRDQATRINAKSTGRTSATDSSK